MYFEGRELKPYAEPVSAPDLKEGSIYFSVQYLDDRMLIPVVETLVFIGRNLDPGDTAKLYFQDAESYRQGVRYDAANSRHDAIFQVQDEREVNHIFEFERALDRLLTCSLNRGKAGTVR